MQQPGMSPWPGAPYASLLLNEIHTLFPALLYDSSRFTSVYSVLQYVQAQMVQRYDIFSHQRSLYMQQNSVRPPPGPAAPRSRQSYVPPARFRSGYTPVPVGQPAVPTTAPEMSVRVTSELDPGMLPSLLSQTLLLEPLAQALLGTLAGVPQQPPGPTFFDPVVVAPTAAQIQAGTTVLMQPGTSDTPCAVCQDTINDSDIVRQILGCRHTFHRACIDTWLQRNVHCPVCRHDVRTPLAQHTAQQPPIQQPSSS